MLRFTFIMIVCEPILLQTVETIIVVDDQDSPHSSGLIKRVLHNVSVPVGKESDPMTFKDSDPRKFSVVLSFKVVCAENYYGQNCSRFCNESCTCDPGFTGEFCHEIDDCVGVDCSNNGRCLDEENSYACVCNPGFTGESCQVDIDECIATNCNGRGQCIDLTNDFNCDCIPGYTGKECEIDIDDCLVSGSSPCNGNGQCIDGENYFICECEPGFTGRTCEMDMHMTNDSDCAAVNCSSHGQCSMDYVSCVCFRDYTGEHCEVNIMCDIDAGFTGPYCNQCM